TLRVLIRVEPVSLLSRLLQGQAGTTTSTQLAFFNVGLAIADERGTLVPDLATALPQLNTDSWKVNPDGTMETTYRLKPNLTWHDDQPLTADDFVYAFSLYNSKAGLALFLSTPQDRMSDVVAPDPGTVLIRWKTP